VLHVEGYSARTLLWRVGLVLASVAAFVGPSSASALVRTPMSRHVGVCNSHRSQALKTTRQVLVWEKRTGTDPISFGPLSTLYACLRPAGASIAIGQDSEGSGDTVGNVGTSDLSIRGALVSDLFTTGLASREACSISEGPSDPLCATVSTDTVRLFNLLTHRSLRQRLAAADVDYAYSPAGAIAWEAPTNPQTAATPLMLQAVSFDPSRLTEGRIETLDTGALGLSLRFTGLRLHWTNAGQPKSLVLSSQ